MSSSCRSASTQGQAPICIWSAFGRLAKKALSIVTEHAYCSKSASLDDETISALKLYRTCSMSQRPRTVHRSISKVFFIFTDACFEPESSSVKAGIGAVLVDSSGNVTHFFLTSLRDNLVDEINKTQHKTVIFELELFAILCAVIVWRQFITNCAVVVYTDNDACNISSCNARPILDLYLKVEFQSSFNAWMSRVPTDSTIADAPSRGDCKSLHELGASETNVSVEMVWNDVQEFQMSGGGKDQQSHSPRLQKECASGQREEFNQAVQRIAT